jgi:hypothetical protein
MGDQEFNQIIDISGWDLDEDYGVYPEGARDKTLYRCPVDTPHSFLLPGHRYLFKRSIERHPHQFWMEVIAYGLGKVAKVRVPRAIVAYSARTNQVGALIEWFYQVGGKTLYVPGGNYMQRLIPGYDRKKGRQHNFSIIARFGKALSRNKHVSFSSWICEWAKVVVFDALIGNTDRHQDNWGILWTVSTEGFPSAELAPAFDNGTSLGYEILETNLFKFNDNAYLERYAKRGRHHMRWELSDSEQQTLFDFVGRFAAEFEEARPIMLECLTFEPRQIEEVLDLLSQLQISPGLSIDRCKFLYRLIEFRRSKLLAILGGGQ